MYSAAIWKDGPLYYNQKKWLRKMDKKVALKYFDNSNIITDEFFSKV